MNSVLGTNITKNDINDIYPLGRGHDAPIKIEFISNLKKETFAKVLWIWEAQNSQDIEKNLRIQRENKENICFIKNEKLYVNGTAYEVADFLEVETSEFIYRDARSDPGSPVPQLENKQYSPSTIEPSHFFIGLVIEKTSAQYSSQSAEAQEGGQSLRNLKKNGTNKEQATPKVQLTKVVKNTGHYRTRFNSGSKR